MCVSWGGGQRLRRQVPRAHSVHVKATNFPCTALQPPRLHHVCTFADKSTKIFCWGNGKVFVHQHHCQDDEWGGINRRPRVCATNTDTAQENFLTWPSPSSDWTRVLNTCAALVRSQSSLVFFEGPLLKFLPGIQFNTESKRHSQQQQQQTPRKHARQVASSSARVSAHAQTHTGKCGLSPCGFCSAKGRWQPEPFPENIGAPGLRAQPNILCSSRGKRVQTAIWCTSFSGFIEWEKNKTRCVWSVNWLVFLKAPRCRSRRMCNLALEGNKRTSWH